MSAEKKKKPFKLRKKEKQFLLVSFIWCLLLSLLFIGILKGVFIQKNVVEIGTIFESFVGIFVTFFGSILVYKALQSQIKANKIISEQFKIQQFESQFYEMLRLHKENVNEMNITGYYKSIEIAKEFDGENNLKKMVSTEKQVDKYITGRKVFVSMVKELLFCCDFCIEFNNLNEKKFTKENMLELGYKIFFHGSSSKFISNNIVHGDFVKSIKEELKKIRKEHKKTNGTYNSHLINNKNINLHIKYTPFTGHVSRLGHYYRHLFYMVKFVVKNENDELFDYNKSREYLKLLRAQMSNDEQLLLYYNYKIGFGSKWENDENKFLSKYRMLHNLPTGKVRYNNPVNVFKEQIKQIAEETNGEETMFEWGDE